jgi:bacterioferritin-associated ferredoxin
LAVIGCPARADGLNARRQRCERIPSREQQLSGQQVYDCLGCSVQCGRCARGVKRIITEASTACVERAAEGMSGLRNGGYLEVTGIGSASI